MTLASTDDLLGPGASNLKGLRILVVEDSWEVSAALKGLLESSGADVIGPVATPADAARLASERTIDVALVDINLRDGKRAYELIDQLHDQRIRVVVLTGYDELALSQGKVAAVLHKPVQEDLLFRSLRSQ